MRFLVDECTGPAVAEWLRTQNHEVFSVYDEARGLGDANIIQSHADQLPNQFVVVTESQVRVARA